MRQKLWFILLLGLVLISCKHKKKVSLSGEDPITVSDFIESFQPLNLPFNLTDASLAKTSKDSLLISYKIFTQFVPDSHLARLFGKNVKPKIYPLGKVTGANKENYLFVKALSPSRQVAYVASFDKKNNFVAAMPVLVPDASPATQQSFSFDKRFTLSTIITRKNSDGTTSDGKDVYVLNEDAKAFVLILTDVLDEKNVEVINPIDTMTRKNKFSGDYVKDKKNLVSVRDNKRPNRITFFVHFEKNNGNCIGDLKGEATLTSPNIAVYRNAGDPCSLQFNFTGSSVTLSELQGCGSHRGLDCLFEGTYPKKKEARKKKK